MQKEDQGEFKKVNLKLMHRTMCAIFTLGRVTPYSLHMCCNIIFIAANFSISQEKFFRPSRISEVH